MDRKQIEKMIAVALSPGAYDEEAISALRKAREVVRKNPALAHPEPPQALPPPPTPPPDHSIQYRISNVSRFWLPPLLSNLSEQAYGLGLRSKLSCVFSEESTAIDVRCDGPQASCGAFVAHLNWLLNHVNSQPPQT
jgi:hypothetical protein